MLRQSLFYVFAVELTHCCFLCCLLHAIVCPLSFDHCIVCTFFQFTVTGGPFGIFKLSLTISLKLKFTNQWHRAWFQTFLSSLIKHVIYDPMPLSFTIWTSGFLWLFQFWTYSLIYVFSIVLMSSCSHRIEMRLQLQYLSDVSFRFTICNRY